MCKIIGITNRHLCEGDYYTQIEKVVRIMDGRLEAIVVREKDLSPEEYMVLAKRVLEICHEHACKCILHSYPEVALELGCRNIHLPLHKIEEMHNKIEGKQIFNEFNIVGVSTHSVEDALKAQNLGATYITAGHVFATDCKKDLPPRGLSFLKNICDNSEVPVYAIGGMTKEREPEVMRKGASGICIMSGCMRE